MRKGRKEYLVLNYVNVIFIGFLFFTILIIFYLFNKSYLTTDIPTNAKLEKYHVPEVDTLTAEEVSLERLKFTSGPIVDERLARKGQFFENEQSEAAYNLDDLSSNTSPEQIIFYEKESEQGVSKQIVSSGKEPIEPDSSVKKSDIPPISTNSTIVTTRSLDRENLIVRTIEATLYSKNSTDNTLIITVNNILNFVKILPETKILINGKKITFSNLKTGDKLTLEGLTNENSTYIEAKTIIVNGSTSIVPIN